MRLFFQRKARLNAAQQQRLARLPAPHSKQALNQRLVVVDVEATGLNTRRDHILAIGAVALEQGAVMLNQRFYCVLNREHEVNDTVLIHRLGPETLAQGVSVEEGLLAFLEFVGASPLFAFHAPYDEQLLTRECKQHLKYKLQHPVVDVAQMAPLLMAETPQQNTLEAWLAHLGLSVSERHNALADAYATAKMLALLLNKAQRQHITTLMQLKSALQRQAQLPAMF